MNIPHDNHFARIPYALFDARMRGEITGLMFNIMGLIHRWADWNTGVVRNMSAERIHKWLGDDEEDVPCERTIQRHMQGLVEAGWLLSDYRKGSKRPYSVTITNYMPPDADQDADQDADKYPLNKREIKHWMDTRINQGAERDADKDADKTVTRRGEDAEKAANTQILPDSSSDSSLDSSSDSSSLLEGREDGRKVEPTAPIPEPNPTSENDRQERTTFDDLVCQIADTYEQRNKGKRLHLSRAQKIRLRKFVGTFKPLGPAGWQQPEAQVHQLFGLWFMHHPTFKGVGSIIDVFISQHDQELSGLDDWNRDQAENLGAAS
jgi:hypothetical protein